MENIKEILVKLYKGSIPRRRAQLFFYAGVVIYPLSNTYKKYIGLFFDIFYIPRI